MKSKQTMFFIVLDDIKQILHEIESDVDICYYKAGLLDSREVPKYNSIFDTPNVGIALSGDWNRIDTYMILKSSTELNIREVPQIKGGMKFAVDQMVNRKSIELKLGGIFQEKGNIIVAGRVASISDDRDSKELYNLFSSKIKKNFKKIDVFYVGNIAEKKLQEGWRLVTNENSPKEYDLTLS
ncbi:hypothetical protein [Chryseobacterium lathyri]|uniref:Uncharacterized protein n=1 Tax=Chryseobacterium lathyri TaxID=395933 RepID=A0A511YEX6_9FLAO|nr:hypothetical protein [Chryseobacterium lathyri]GEN73747.1 hypothetical protein CLA01_38190 [Chryseobacterium lathyri]